MLGYKHTEEALAKMSGANNPMYGRTGANSPRYGEVPANAIQSGANNPMFGRTHTPETLAKMSDSKLGANNPMYGITPSHAMTVNVYSLDGKLINSFSSQVAVAKWLGVNQSTVSRHIKYGKVWNNLYRFVKSMS
jgi:group I intron endonuclease